MTHKNTVRTGNFIQAVFEEINADVGNMNNQKDVPGGTLKADGGYSAEPPMPDTYPGKKVEFVEYNNVRKILKDAIATIEGKQIEEIDDRFLEDATYRIDRKDRDRTVQLKLISEQDTRYENFAKPGLETRIEYTFTTSYEDSQSLSLTTAKGFTIRIGANHGDSHTEKKNLHIKGTVDPGKCVTVKEVVHNAVKNVACDVVLIIDKDVQVPFTLTNGTKKDPKMIKWLLNNEALRNDPCVRIFKGRVEFHVRQEFNIETREHALEVHTHDTKKERVTRVNGAYEEGDHEYANDKQKE